MRCRAITNMRAHTLKHNRNDEKSACPQSSASTVNMIHLVARVHFFTDRGHGAEQRDGGGLVEHGREGNEALQSRFRNFLGLIQSKKNTERMNFKVKMIEGCIQTPDGKVSDACCTTRGFHLLLLFISL